MRQALWITFLFFLAPQLCFAQEKQTCVSGACFDSTARVEGKELPLRGATLFRYWGFKVYSAAIYSATEVKSKAQLLGNVPKLLILQYHRDLTAENFVENANITLAKNPSVDTKKLKGEIDQLHSFYQGVGEGDRYTLSYAPGKGTTLSLNGVKKGTVVGKEFAEAYFGIWLSPCCSVNESFSDRLFSDR